MQLLKKVPKKSISPSFETQSSRNLDELHSQSKTKSKLFEAFIIPSSKSGNYKQHIQLFKWASLEIPSVM